MPAEATHAIEVMHTRWPAPVPAKSMQGEDDVTSEHDTKRGDACRGIQLGCNWQCQGHGDAPGNQAQCETCTHILRHQKKKLLPDAAKKMKDLVASQ